MPPHELTSQKQWSFWKMIKLGRGRTFFAFSKLFFEHSFGNIFPSLIFRSNSHQIRERNWYILTVGGHSAGEGCISDTRGSLLNWIFESQCFQVCLLIFNYQYDNLSLNHSQNRIWKLKCHWESFISELNKSKTWKIVFLEVSKYLSVGVILQTKYGISNSGKRLCHNGSYALVSHILLKKI